MYSFPMARRHEKQNQKRRRPKKIRSNQNHQRQLPNQNRPTTGGNVQCPRPNVQGMTKSQIPKMPTAENAEEAQRLTCSRARLGELRVTRRSWRLYFCVRPVSPPTP